MPDKGKEKAPDHYFDVNDALEIGNEDAAEIERENERIYRTLRLRSADSFANNSATIQRQVGRLQERVYAPGPLRETQSGANSLPGFGAGDGNDIPMDRLGDRSSRSSARNSESSRNNNSRRYLCGLGIPLALTTASTIVLAILFGLLRARATGQPAPEAADDETAKTIYERLDEWEKATKDDTGFWEFFAKLVTDTDPAIKPKLTLADNIPFCSYVIDHHPVDSFLFDAADDATIFVMRLVAAYRDEIKLGKSFGEAAAVAYRLAPTLRYAPAGKPEAAFPRAVQALLLRWAFGVLVYPSPAAEMMERAAQWADLDDAAYWAQFSAYLADIKAKPPLTLSDQIEFCNDTVAVSAPSDFAFARQELEDAAVAKLVAAFDKTTKSTAAIYPLLPTLEGEPGTPLPRRIQAQLARHALARIDTPASGPSLFELVQQWAHKSDSDYWSAFVEYKKTTPSPLALLDEIHFCTFTVEQFPVPPAFVPLPKEGVDAHVARLKARYDADQRTEGVYPLLANLEEFPPQLPRAIQAQLMRLLLVQIMG